MGSSLFAQPAPMQNRATRKAPTPPRQAQVFSIRTDDSAGPSQLLCLFSQVHAKLIIPRKSTPGKGPAAQLPTVSRLARSDQSESSIAAGGLRRAQVPCTLAAGSRSLRSAMAAISMQHAAAMTVISTQHAAAIAAIGG